MVSRNRMKEEEQEHVMKIGVKESTAIISLLKSAESRPFDETFGEFVSTLPREYHFLVCCALVALLEDKMLKASERLGALAILHQTYSSQPPSSNPFIDFLVKTAFGTAFLRISSSHEKQSQTQPQGAACDDGVEHLEKSFIQLLLRSIHTNNDKEVLKLSAADYINGFDSSSHVLLQHEQLQGQHGNGVHQKDYYSIITASAVKNVIPDPDLPGGYDLHSFELKSASGAKRIKGSADSADRDAALAGLLQNFSLDGLRPQWIRPSPPMLPVLDAELMWLIPDGKHELLWDHTMCDDTGPGAALRELITKALKGPLSRGQQEQVLVETARDPQLVYRCGITPGKLQELVENNPTFAAAILIHLRNSAEISEYFDVLVNMDTSLYSMEVVSRLITAVEVPTDFLHRYITKCISFCEKIKDRYMQRRLVRLVSVFLQSLIRNKYDLKDVAAEVRDFCMKFPRIKEASCLNNLL